MVPSISQLITLYPRPDLPFKIAPEPRFREGRTSDRVPEQGVHGILQLHGPLQPLRVAARLQHKVLQTRVEGSEGHFLVQGQDPWD